MANVNASDWCAAMDETVPAGYEFMRWNSGARVVDGHRGTLLRAKHDCGSVTEIVIDDDDVRWDGVEMEFVKAWERLYGSCYCVRREVLVPCTHQRCEP